MLTATTLLLATHACNQPDVADDNFIGRQQPELKTDRMTPEALWAMGRIGSFNVSPNGKEAVYTVSYYSVKQNKSHSVVYTMNLEDLKEKLLTTSTKSESSPVYLNEGKQIAFLSSESGSSQVWIMNADGSDRKRISNTEKDIADFLFSPDEKQVILIMEVDQNHSIAPKDEDLPETSGMVINDMMYKHWDTFVTTAPHPFVAEFDGKTIGQTLDILEGEPYECPMLPFGGIEQLAWSPNSQEIAYTCRKKLGRDYAISTDSDIYLYNLAAKTTKNLCKPADFKAPEVEYFHRPDR